MMKKKRVHLICNAHIDPIWQWDWQEGASAVLSTFRSAANLADQYDYIFCHNEVTAYKYVEEYAPELFEKIRDILDFKGILDRNDNPNCTRDTVSAAIAIYNLLNIRGIMINRLS